MSEIYEIAIIGLGAIGSAALYSASKLGLKIIGIDKFTPPSLVRLKSWRNQDNTSRY